MTKLYQELKISKTASQSEIKSAYRKLAKQYHPDLHPGDKANQAKFQAITNAYEILGDEKKRKQYDQGQIDEQGNEKSFFRKGSAGAGQAREGFQYQRDFGGQQNFQQGFQEGGAFSSIFGDLFGSHAKQERKMPPQEVTLKLQFEEAAIGCKKKIKCPSGKIVDLKIPASSQTGQKLRIAGQGKTDPTGKERDLMVVLNVLPSHYYQQKGDDVYTDLSISLKEAILGTKKKVKTLDGEVQLNIQPHSNTDQILRLKDKGIANAVSKIRGHHYVRLKIKLDNPNDPTLENFVKKHYS